MTGDTSGLLERLESLRPLAEKYAAWATSPYPSTALVNSTANELARRVCEVLDVTKERKHAVLERVWRDNAEVLAALGDKKGVDE